ncbi:Caffeic acid 3-O-methyltransferase [Senna tora]|uniref:Caffeic acid 3-O-methyltransferase n=1 Tax=Senna tora TaxID=362788 RepID=A0A834XGB9_9FABA|nr:Caffeic acid 3-O-methyltransferase [Senna tora]
MDLIEYLEKDSEFNKYFNTALTQHSCIVMKKVLESYKGFENINTLVDVGGGLGFSLSMITSKYPHIKAINLDLPHVIQHAPPYPGVEHVAGDMFESVPKADVILMKVVEDDVTLQWIFCSWSDKKCVKLLKNCYAAIPENGKVIVVESSITDMPDTTAATKCNFELDVFMMAQYPGEKERNRHEFMQLGNAAGFTGVKYQCRARNFWRQRQRWPSLSFRQPPPPLQLLGDSNLETRSLFDEIRSFDKRCFFFDLGHPLVNRIAESFIKAAGVTSP